MTLEAAAKFALHITGLTHKKMASRRRPSHIKPAAWTRYEKLALDMVCSMTTLMNWPTEKGKSELWDVFTEAKQA
jgi:hypothetical protein